MSDLEGKRRDGWWTPQGRLAWTAADTSSSRPGRRATSISTAASPRKASSSTRFGYYVARIQLQKQPGHWPAFWIYGAGVGKVGNDGRTAPRSTSWRNRALDDRVDHNLHWDGYGKDHKTKGTMVSVPGVMEGFHTFAVWWKPDEYVFYVDGQETWRHQRRRHLPGARSTSC